MRVEATRERFDLSLSGLGHGSVRVANTPSVHILCATVTNEVQCQRHQPATSRVSNGALASARYVDISTA